ncbi:MAG: hypothetical protein HQK83_01585 [Fibrobacteria bacterium]|nr:hypothetical protein [Fibrobacteria bacterium]
MKDRLFSHYQKKGFQMLEMVFDEKTKLMNSSGNFSLSDNQKIAQSSLTDLHTLTRYVNDSLQVKNIQGIFLFSDGRNTKNNSLGGIPILNSAVFPALISADSFRDIQIEEVGFSGCENNLSGTKKFCTAELTWTNYGNPKEPITANFIDNHSVIYQKVLLAQCTNSKDAERCIARISIPKNIQGRLSSKNLNVALSRERGNSNPFNDTLRVSVETAATKPYIFFLKHSIQSMDEKWTIDILRKITEFRVGMVTITYLLKKEQLSGSQLWLPVSVLKRHLKSLVLLKKKGLQIVVYGPYGKISQEIFTTGYSARTNAGGFFRFAPIVRNYFTNSGLSLDNITEQQIKLPEVSNNQNCLISIEQEGNRACLFSKSGKDSLSFFRIMLTGFWKKMFLPNEPYQVKEQIKSIIQGVAEYTNEQKNDVSVFYPAMIYDNIAFSFAIKKRLTSSSTQNQFQLVIQNSDSTKSFSLKNKNNNQEELLLEAHNIFLPQGKYAIKVQFAQTTLWSDSITVHSKLQLELGRIGFDRSTLAKIANSSGGSILDAQFQKDSLVLSYPEFSAGEIKELKEKRTPLYNRKIMFLLIVLLMTAYWALRKKWAVD